jgi:uncharacterized protein DUF4387
MTQPVPITRLARLARSKNAGPFVVSLDLVFSDRATYDAVRASGAVSRETIAALYRLPLERVSDVIEYPAANALKINLLRERPAGSFGETDLYGSQCGALLDNLLVPIGGQ